MKKTNETLIKKLTHVGVGGQKGWVYSIDGIMSTLPASQYKDPAKILVKKNNKRGKSIANEQ